MQTRRLSCADLRYGSAMRGGASGRDGSAAPRMSRRRRSRPHAWASIALTLGSPVLSRADFVFPDFNDTTGLSWVGDVGSTNCKTVLANAYGTVQGLADNSAVSIPVRRAETVDITTETSMHSLDISMMDVIEAQESVFGHQHAYAPSQNVSRCPVRVRLTPSQPNKRGAMWFSDPLPIDRGFTSMFTFQITDPSTVCTLHRDASFSLVHHRSCSVHGGDGFAFVVQASLHGDKALGHGDREMGFGGLSNSLAVAFDPWYNTEAGSGDLVVDHVSIHSGGPTANNTADEASMLGRPRAANISDGKVHLAKISYYPEVKTEYLEHFSASDALLPFIKDVGEGRRLGTLVVFMDEGVGSNTPVIAILINIHAALDMDQARAYVGFTGATGAAWEKHDILSWYFCHDEPCSATERQTFDYHQQSVYYTGARHGVNDPGHGYGGGGGFYGAPTQHLSPDTDPWNPPGKTEAVHSVEGLYSAAASQVPPNVQG